MIPLKDINRSQTTPFVTVILIVANGLIFLYELSLGQRSLSRFLFAFGVVPAFYFDASYWQSTGC